MNRKEIIIVVTALVVMIAGILLSLKALYPDSKNGKRHGTTAGTTIVRAVPSDAVAFITLDGSPKSAEIVSDTTAMLKSFLGTPVTSFLSTVSRPKAVISLHNSGSLIPLVALEMSAADSLEIATATVNAAAAGLKSSYVVSEGILLASTSETLIASSIRHLGAGMSVLDDEALADLFRGGDPSSLYLNHRSASKLLQVYGSAQLRERTSFIKSFTPWTQLRLEDVSRSRLILKGSCCAPDNNGYFISAVGASMQGNVSVMDVLPFNTAYFTAIPVPSLDKYVDSYRKYLDVRGLLSSYDKAAQKKDASGISPLSWTKELRPLEVAVAKVPVGDGMQDVLMVKMSKEMPRKPTPFFFGGYIGAVFGPLFRLNDESFLMQLKGRWSVIGPESAVNAFAAEDYLKYTLRSRFQDNSISVPSGAVVYASLTDYPAAAQKVFSSRLAVTLSRYAEGAAYVSAILNANGEAVSAEVIRHNLKGNAAEAMFTAPLDTLVEVPKGPFKVINSGTGKENTFYQNSAMSLCLNDENGKGLWGVPFKQPICGYVETIDYFNNKKLQFLFAAGSKLYLIDRLGRFVNGFPVELGKEVLLGPGVYDFSGSKHYNAIILHKDNTIEMYNLKGQKSDKWKGIRPPETVKHLPESLTCDGKNYWVVRTSLRTLIYPFYGGQPLTDGEGGKMFSPDTKLSLTGKGSVEGVCLDGKTHSIKL